MNRKRTPELAEAMEEELNGRAFTTEAIRACVDEIAEYAEKYSIINTLKSEDRHQIISDIVREVFPKCKAIGRDEDSYHELLNWCADMRINRKKKNKKVFEHSSYHAFFSLLAKHITNNKHDLPPIAEKELEGNEKPELKDIIEAHTSNALDSLDNDKIPPKRPTEIPKVEKTQNKLPKNTESEEHTHGLADLIALRNNWQQEKGTIRTDTGGQDTVADYKKYYEQLFDYIDRLNNENYQERFFSVYRKELQKFVAHKNNCAAKTAQEIHAYFQNNGLPNLYSKINEQFKYLNISE